MKQKGLKGKSDKFKNKSSLIKGKANTVARRNDFDNEMRLQFGSGLQEVAANEVVEASVSDVMPTTSASLPGPSLPILSLPDSSSATQSGPEESRSDPTPLSAQQDSDAESDRTIDFNEYQNADVATINENADDTNESALNGESSEPMRTRYGRIIKPVEKNNDVAVIERPKKPRRQNRRTVEPAIEDSIIIQTSSLALVEPVVVLERSDALTTGVESTLEELVTAASVFTTAAVSLTTVTSSLATSPVMSASTAAVDTMSLVSAAIEPLRQQ